MNTPTSSVIEIPLTQGQIATISAEDRDLAELRWFAVFYPKLNRFYAKRNTVKENGKPTTVYLHRVILERVIGRKLSHADEVDHINRKETLNNQRHNLRLATKAQNMHNTAANVNNISGLKGVSFHKATGLWRARVTHEGKERNLGYFQSPEEAAHAYDKVIGDLRGAFAYKNYA
jgi:hypothetical protein